MRIFRIGNQAPFPRPELIQDWNAATIVEMTPRLEVSMKIGNIILLTTLSTADSQKKATKEPSFEGYGIYFYLNETNYRKSYAVAEIFV